MNDAKATGASTRRRSRSYKPLVYLLLATPAAWLLYQAFSNNLGPDPAEYLVGQTGEWTIRLLCLTLLISPLQAIARKFLPSLKLIPYRRGIGVATWAYALLHLLSYSGLLLAWRWSEIGSELIERPYIAVGFAAVLILTPLALTSTNGMVRKLGKRWKSLHRGVYLVAVLAAVHIIWQIRSDYWDALFYSSLIASLLAWRFWSSRSSRTARS